MPNSYADTYVGRLEALTLACPGVVATGWLAAAIYGHPWLPDPVPTVVTTRRRINRPGIVCHRYEVPIDEVRIGAGPGGTRIQVASPAWALFDLARRLPRNDAVAALDGGLGEDFAVDPAVEFRRLKAAHPKLRNSRRALAMVELMDPRSESHWETISRLRLGDWGFDFFVPQYKVPELP